MKTRGLDDFLKALNQLKDDLDDDFKWLDAVRKIRGLRDDFPLISAATVSEMFDLCDQITREYPTDYVIETQNPIIELAKVPIKTILDRLPYVPDREEAEQTAYQILMERLERGLTHLTLGYIRLIVKQAVFGDRRRNYKQVLKECRRQAEKEIEQHRAEYERICKETNQELTEAGFEKYIEQWCKDLASDILNSQDRIGTDEEEGEIELPAPEGVTELPDDLDECELETFHVEIGEAFMSYQSVPPARLIHIFYQVHVLGKDQNDVALEISYDEATVSRELGHIKKAIETIREKEDYGYDFKEMTIYFAWLRDCLPSRICFAHPNDLKYLIKCAASPPRSFASLVKRKEGGKVMWKVYDWFRKNWCSLQSSQNFHIDINERWYMDVGIDLDNESAEITRVTLKSDFRKEGQSC